MTDNRPIIHRLSVKELQRVLAALSPNGKIGFDPNRDERTNSKSKLIEYIQGNFDTDRSATEICRVYEAREDSGNTTSTTTPATVLRDTPAQPADFPGFPVASPMPATTPAPAVSSNDPATQLANLIGQLTQSSVDLSKVETMIAERVQAAMERMTVRHEIIVPDLPAVNVGIQHKQFPKLLKACNARLSDGARLNIWLAGPAGSGKTTAARKVAEALSLPFLFVGAIDQPYKLTGFVDASGNYHRTAFREAWENGGVFVFDEVDGSSPSAVLEFNAALANGCAAFPDQAAPMDRHPDCVIVAGANTFGQGGTTDYVGRSRLDAAFLDRFVMLDWPVDETLERAIASNADWVTRVQTARQNVKRSNIRNHNITPRATVYGEALLAAGLAQSDVENMVLKKGATKDDWTVISA